MSQARDFADSFSGVSTGRRNLIINGAMQVAQRGDVTGVTTENKYGCDRFATNGAGFGTVSLIQEEDAPEGFAYSQRVKVTTARSTTATSDHFTIGTRLEGQNLQHLEKGTSNAKSMTVSFYAKASQATTIQLELYDNDNSRHAAKEFAITQSWAKYSYTFVGDTTGSFDNDNNLSMYVLFWLCAGTNFTSGTNPDGSWLALDQTRRVHSDVGTTFNDTLNAEFNLTGVQLEVGNSASPFEHRSYGEELQMCKRYFYRAIGGNASGGDGSDNYIRFANGSCHSTTEAQGSWQLPVEMRDQPTLSPLGSDNHYAIYESLDINTCSSTITRGNSGSNRQVINWAVNTTGLGDGNGCELIVKNQTGDASIDFSAEL